MYYSSHKPSRVIDTSTYALTVWHSFFILKYISFEKKPQLERRDYLGINVTGNILVWTHILYLLVIYSYQAICILPHKHYELSNHSILFYLNILLLKNMAIIIFKVISAWDWNIWIVIPIPAYCRMARFDNLNQCIGLIRISLYLYSIIKTKMVTLVGTHDFTICIGCYR